MKALQLTSPGVLELVDLPRPVPGPGEVLLEVGGAGLCHSDLHVLHVVGEMLPLPLTLGHEIAGRVAEVGAGVAGWSPDDAALVHLIWSCGSCRACARGDDNVCEAAGRAAQPPTPGLGPAGGMAEHILVPARFLVPIGDLDPVRAAPLADAGMTAYHAIHNSRRTLQPGNAALVIGVGGLGHAAVQILRATTAVRIMAVDIAPDKLEAARRHGADVVLEAGSDTAAAVLEMTQGRGVDTVLDFVGSQSSVDLAAGAIGPDGIVQLVGIAGGVAPIVAEPRFGTVWPYGASIRTSYGGTRSDLEACVALARAGRLEIDVTTFALDDAVSAFEQLEQGHIGGRAVIVP